MLKKMIHDILLSVQSRTGITTSFIVCLCIIIAAGIIGFAFLCVAGYAWLSLQIGSVYAGLVMAGVFFLIALIGIGVCAVTRRRARERAILERAARAHAPSWLLDPRVLATAVQIGREFGWQRIIPVALVGFMATQWARDRRKQGQEPSE
jgi:hypothetical protein